MRLSEFDYKHHINLVDQLMTANGYKKLGQGTDAVVYEKDAGNAIKIIIPESGDQDYGNQAHDLFLEFCQANQSPHLPRIIVGDKPIEIDGEEFKQVVMEKLQPVTDPLTVAILDIFASDDPDSSSYSRYNTWEQALQDLHEFKDNGELGDVAEKLLQTRPWPTDQELTAKFGNFFKVAKALFDYNQFHWDLHAGNVMQRADGTLVIIDPWVSY